MPQLQSRTLGGPSGLAPVGACPDGSAADGVALESPTAAEAGSDGRRPSAATACPEDIRFDVGWPLAVAGVAATFGVAGVLTCLCGCAPAPCKLSRPRGSRELVFAPRLPASDRGAALSGDQASRRRPNEPGWMPLSGSGVARRLLELGARSPNRSCRHSMCRITGRRGRNRPPPASSPTGSAKLCTTRPQPVRSWLRPAIRQPSESGRMSRTSGILVSIVQGHRCPACPTTPGAVRLRLPLERSPLLWSRSQARSEIAPALCAVQGACPLVKEEETWGPLV